MPGPNSHRGKTVLDHASGKWDRHLRNQKARADYNRRMAASQKAGGLQIVAPPNMGEI